MLRILFTAVFVFLCVSFASAQSDYHKFEVSGGYSFERVKSFPGDRLQGATTSGNGLLPAHIKSQPTYRFPNHRR